MIQTLFEMLIYGMMVLGLPITIIEDMQGRQDKVIEGQQGMLIAAAMLIWLEVFR